MTEIATVEHSPLMQWALDAHEAHKIAQSLVKTAFVPDSMRNKPEEATGCILTGQEIGLQPMASLRSIDIIAGTPAMRANAMRGLVQSQGHRVTLIEATETRAVVEGQRRGESVPQRSVWTIERAKKLGLTGKPNWTTQPTAMLIARATAECCRLIASDVLMGVPYAVEELQDDAEPSVEAPIRKRTARRAQRAVDAPEPSFPDPEPEEAPKAVEAAPEPREGVAVENGQEWPEPPADWESGQ